MERHHTASSEWKVSGTMSPLTVLCQEFQACGVCGWSVGQTDHDEEMGSMRGMYGTLDAELEVQLTMRVDSFLVSFYRPLHGAC